MKQSSDSFKNDIPYLLHTPQTPGNNDVSNNMNSPPVVPNTCGSNQQGSDSSFLASDLPPDLNFDPESVIIVEGSRQEDLNVSLFNRTLSYSKE